MYKLLFLILLSLFVNTIVFSQTPSVDKSSNYQSISFDQLIAKFNSVRTTKNNAKALTYLAQAEDLLVNFKDDNLTNAQTELATAFAKAGDTEKAKIYQQKALAVSRGKPSAVSIANLKKLAKSYVILNDTLGMQIMFEKAINLAPQHNKRPIKIAYVNSLFGVDENVKASTLLTELYSDTPLSTAERAEILTLLLINSLKLNQLQHLDKYYQELAQLKPAQTATYFLAKGMYLEHKNQYTNALKNYHPLFLAFKAGKREVVYLDGVLQLAQLTSKQLKKDSATYLFNLVANALNKPLKSTAIGIRYLKLYQVHQLRFNQSNAVIDKALNTKDSLYQNELIALTKELAYKYKIEQDKQKAELLKKQRDVEALTYAKNKQRSLLIISCLCLLLVGGGAMIYILYQRRKQGNLLHLAELARLKQLHKTNVIRTLSKSQEAERWRIADQLHDEVGSMISVVRLNLSEHPLKDEVISPEKLETANRILANVADTVREMSHQLMPVAIRQYGLINSIEQLISDINTSGKIYIEHLIYGFDDLSKYPEDFQVSFYRIVQELFQNIVKHAKATNAIFQLVEHPDSINLYIEDNGKGIDNDKNDRNGKGIGLLSNRIDYYEGKISIEGQPGKGTLIVIDIPTLHMMQPN
ncbi:tetratricopeptide repeat-containing sensor histidine kinase [Pedobacter planticolens]|nr:ATP-binding protein [Pedobacter planticolens]